MTEQGSTKVPDDAPAPAARTSLFAELQKRRVVRAAIAYAVVAWGITEILDGVISRFGWPDWIATLVVIVFVVGFPVAMFLAWVFDWTKDGIRRTEPGTAVGGMSIVLAIIFLIGATAGLFWLINPSGIVRVEQTGIAVLPCRYRGEPDLAFRGEGLAEIINEHRARSPHFFISHCPPSRFPFSPPTQRNNLKDDEHLRTQASACCDRELGSRCSPSAGGRVLVYRTVQDHM